MDEPCLCFKSFFVVSVTLVSFHKLKQIVILLYYLLIFIFYVLFSNQFQVKDVGAILGVLYSKLI